MKLKKLMIAGLISVTTLVSMVGCSEEAVALKGVGEIIFERFEVIEILSAMNDVYIVKDSKTGVHYIYTYDEDVFTPYYDEQGRIVISGQGVSDRYNSEDEDLWE